MCRSVVIAVALALGGCGDKQVETLSAIKDEVCACKTAACGKAAMRKVPVELKSSPKMQRVANAMLDCMARLSERPADAEEPATSPETSAPASARKP